jgi:DNA-directed RNA polymerase specialized sigma24 family protein
MTYSQVLRYSQVITKDSSIAHDIVHDFYLRLQKQGLDLFKIPKNFVYLGLSRTYVNYYRKFGRYNLSNCLSSIDLRQLGVEKSEADQGMYVKDPNLLQQIDTLPMLRI